LKVRTRIAEPWIKRKTLSTLYVSKITPIRSNQDFGNYSALEIRCAWRQPKDDLFLSLIVSSVIAHKNDILKRLVLEAKREYEKDAEYQVHIFTADA
jgi:hypothetical protein